MIIDFKPLYRLQMFTCDLNSTKKHILTTHASFPTNIMHWVIFIQRGILILPRFVMETRDPILGPQCQKVMRFYASQMQRMFEFFMRITLRFGSYLEAFFPSFPKTLILVQKCHQDQGLISERKFPCVEIASHTQFCFVKVEGDHRHHQTYVFSQPTLNMERIICATGHTQSYVYELYHSSPIMQLTMSHILCWCPQYKPITDKFPLLFENVILRSFKSFFPLDHQVDISLEQSHGGYHTPPL